MSEFFAMGGYAFYVWASYGVTFIVLIVNFIQPLYCARRIKRALARQARLARRHV